MDLTRDLILFYCSGTKCRDGTAVLRLPPRAIAESLTSEAKIRLEKGRNLARQVPGTVFDDAAPEVAAVSLYAGRLYEDRGFLKAIELAISQGVHCLIVSGGYGLVRAEEPIRWYDADMAMTARVWRPRLGGILKECVEGNQIKRVFAAISGKYAKVLKGNWTGGAAYLRHVPTSDYGRDYGRDLVSLIEASLDPGPRWKRVS